MDPENIIVAILLAALTLYAVLGGADFGAGIWEFNTAFMSKEREKKLIYHAIGPVWEANHVWLIFIVVLMFSAFPSALAAISRALWMPLFLALVGIVFRGASFAFRSYSVTDGNKQKRWNIIFAVGSTSAPFFLGACLGAIASGKLEITSDGHFLGNYLTSWLSPLSIFAAFFSVGVCAYLAAFYLTREAWHIRDHELTDLWQKRSLATGIWMGLLAATGLVLMIIEAPNLWHGFKAKGWFLVMASFIFGIGSLFAMYKRSINLAVIGAATTVATVIWGLVFSQVPLIIPPMITIENAKASDGVLWMLIYSTVGGLIILIPSLICLFRIFKKFNPDENPFT